eukprot:CAMPEP_0204181316 /NCGR_PEP_ID=MMETSP0361-20130328/51798_1 /ASSEMBLY_ACC=CAM_ASM_000343 /TAXON_ID=268821 /ORGANISM="Scrippsiella Hangoei, Strain SHTV-5" /LENGTH=101 /DNA_ID=CAMNT_0051140877 /DNA_START=14 /DNA_END=316 /DNA_ORIENTATION=-
MSVVGRGGRDDADRGCAMNWAAMAPNGRSIAAACRDGLVRVWSWQRPGVGDVADEASELLRGHEGEVFAVAFSPDGTKLASASADSTVAIWELPARSLVGR